MRELLKRLSEAFGPSGYEDGVRDIIEDHIRANMPKNAEVIKDNVGGIYLHIKNEGKPVFMVNAHMDEVGFMVSGITDKGLIRFGCIGGMNTIILGAKRVVFENGIKGVIATKPIHLLTKEEKDKSPRLEDMYVDIGAKNKEEAEKFVHVGDFFTFDSPYTEYGDGYIKCKALDDRHGCAIMCKMIDTIASTDAISEYDLWFAFTCREEVSYSGARAAAEYIRPDYALVLESKAVQDMYGIPEEKRVGVLGDGAIISFADNSTIYDRGLVSELISICENNGIKYQMNKYISGGNDASHIQRSIGGVRACLISAPSRYIHSQSNVVKYSDLDSMLSLALKLIGCKNTEIEDKI